ncbi:MAG: cytochrome c oxidase subunit II [Elainellaceae cyanobacterium]
MKQIPVSLLTLTAGIVVTLVSLWVGQNIDLLPEQASAQAPLVDDLFSTMLTIGTALFLVVEGAILVFIVMFRKRAGDETDGEPIEGNLPLEAFWTAIPAIIVIGLGVYSVAVFQEMGGLSLGHHTAMAHSEHGTLVAQAPQDEQTPIAGDVMPLMADAEGANLEGNNRYGIGAPFDELTKPADLVVNVTGIQFAWLFNYPDSGITTGELHVPVGQDVQLNLSAQDVIHSFWVPQFRLKQDALPGEKSELRFVATKVGTYPVVCAELCGSYHGGMRTQVIVHTPEEYAQWLEQNRVAQQDQNQTVAANPADLTPSEFLAPYAQDLGVDSAHLAALR